MMLPVLLKLLFAYLVVGPLEKLREKDVLHFLHDLIVEELTPVFEVADLMEYGP